MDVFDSEIIKSWVALNKYNVRYIMVGGVATNLHDYQRTTDDIDIWIEDSIKNRGNLRVAFKEYGLGNFEMMERLQFVPGWTNFYLNNGLQLDIMVNMKGLEDVSFGNACSWRL